MVHTIVSTNSLVNNFIGELRDVNTQKDSLRFRYNLIRIGEVMAYEISKTLHYKEEKIQTPLGIAVTPQISDQIVLGIILRAGLPLHQGLHNYFDKAENAIISAYRKHSLVDDNDFHIEIEYLSAPSIEGKVLILCDPMLASGMSMVLAHKILTQHRGTPSHTHIVSVIASQKGLDYVKEQLPDNTTIWLGAIDPELNSKSYIVPGLGDAGDLAYGAKL